MTTQTTQKALDDETADQLQIANEFLASNELGAMALSFDPVSGEAIIATRGADGEQAGFARQGRTVQETIDWLRGQDGYEGLNSAL